MRLLTATLLGFVISAATISAQAAILSPTQDSYYTARDGGGPFGSANYFRVKNESTANSRISYIEFDTSTITDAITGATLTLNPQASGLGTDPGSKEFTFTFQGIAGVIWDESTTTPPDDTTATILGTFNVIGTGAGTPANFSSAALTTFLDDNPGKVTFILTRTGTNDNDNYVSQFISSNASSGGPLLTVTAVPEPTSLALALVAGLGVVFGLRRGRRTC